MAVGLIKENFTTSQDVTSDVFVIVDSAKYNRKQAKLVIQLGVYKDVDAFDAGKEPLETHQIQIENPDENEQWIGVQTLVYNFVQSFYSPFAGASDYPSTDGSPLPVGSPE